jgi:hypothetical protein
MIIRFIFLSVFLFFTSLIYAENNIKTEFDKKIKSWQTYISKTKNLDDTKTHINSSPFKNLVALGVPAVPFVIKRLETNPDAIWLNKVLEKILKIRRFESTYDKEKKQFVFNKDLNVSDGVNIWVRWWKVDKYNTKERFDKIYKEYEQVRSLRSHKTYREKYEKVTDEGIPILSKLIKKIRRGEDTLIPMVAVLTNGEVKILTSVKKTLEWWDEKGKEIWADPLEITEEE